MRREIASFEGLAMETARVYRYQADSLLRYTGLSEYGEVTQEAIDAFRAADHGLSPVTVEAYIVGFELLTGRKFGGKKLVAPMKRPKTIPLEDLSKVYAIAKKRRRRWLCWLLKFGYITGLRHANLTGLTRDQIGEDAIEVVAFKTKKLHVIPRHFILQGTLPAGPRPLYRSKNTVSKWINRFCDEAQVPRFTLQMMRRTAVTQYEIAHPGSGMILHGEGLRTIVMKHYCDQYEVLKVAQERLAIPESMLPQDKRWRRQSQEKQLLNSFRGLPEDERKTVLRLIGRAG